MNKDNQNFLSLFISFSHLSILGFRQSSFRQVVTKIKKVSTQTKTKNTITNRSQK